jgi:hypothetical protein
LVFRGAPGRNEIFDAILARDTCAFPFQRGAIHFPAGGGISPAAASRPAVGTHGFRYGAFHFFDAEKISFNGALIFLNGTPVSFVGRPFPPTD